MSHSYWQRGEDAGGDGKTGGFKDCLKGSSGYYANKVSQGENKAVNTVLGLGVSRFSGNVTRGVVDHCTAVSIG